jgi:hypothetical protein
MMVITNNNGYEGHKGSSTDLDGRELVMALACQYVHMEEESFT